MAGTDRKQNPGLGGGPAIVLVEPQLHENIGMVARAKAKFGLDDLRLVAPAPLELEAETEDESRA